MVCCNQENQYRNETQNHPNRTHQANSYCPCHQDHHHCCQEYGYVAGRNYRGFCNNRGSHYFGIRCWDQQQDNNWRNPHTKPRSNTFQGYSPPGRDDQLKTLAPTSFEHNDSIMSTPVTCFDRNQPLHSANQCPNKIRGKAPTINMITIDVQQVTTLSKTAQPSQWDIQDSIWQQATEWVEAANNHNIERMKSSNATFPQPQIESP